MFTQDEEKEATKKILENLQFEEYLNILKSFGRIREFSAELLQDMNKINVGNKTLYQHFVDYTTRGECFSMSVALSMILPHPNTIIRCTINMPLNKFTHQFVEYNNEIYDTTFHAIYLKDDYYNIYNPTDVSLITDVEVENIINKPFYNIFLCDKKSSNENFKKL